MYISKLQLNIDVSCKAVLRDLANPHDLHRTIMRAFPSRSDGGPGRVLFRVEPATRDAPPCVLVLSDKAPDWSLLQDVDNYLLAADIKEFSPAFLAGQRLRFRLRANPTVKRDGKRHALFKEQEQLAWLERKAQASGFMPVGVTTCRHGCRNSKKTDPNGTQRMATHFGVDFEGVLEVTQPDKLISAINAGIGSGKAFGFGLLSVAK